MAVLPPPSTALVVSPTLKFYSFNDASEGGNTHSGDWQKDQLSLAPAGSPNSLAGRICHPLSGLKLGQAYLTYAAEFLHRRFFR